MNWYQTICEEIRKSDLYEYTVEYSELAKKEINSNKILSAEEHTSMSELDFARYCTSKEGFIEWYFGYLSNISKLDALSVAGSLIKDNKIKNIVSFGCGPAVLEYLLKIFNPSLKITVSDYDEYLVNNARQMFSDLQCEKFDFYKDDVHEFVKRLGNVDMAILFGSACSMDTQCYIKFLKALRSEEIPYVLSFEAGIENNCNRAVRHIMVCFTTIIKLMFNKYTKGAGKAFHAYSRTSNNLKKVFRKAGYDFSIIPNVRCYRHTYLLNIKK